MAERGSAELKSLYRMAVLEGGDRHYRNYEPYRQGLTAALEQDTHDRHSFTPFLRTYRTECVRSKEVPRGGATEHNSFIDW